LLYYLGSESQSWGAEEFKSSGATGRVSRFLLGFSKCDSSGSLSSRLPIYFGRRDVGAVPRDDRVKAEPRRLRRRVYALEFTTTRTPIFRKSEIAFA
jgi:hypothetical protein